MIGRIVWYAGIAAITVVTAVVQLDRQSAIAPVYAASVPDFARGFAQAQIAAASQRSPNRARALAEAEKLVRRRPVPAETLRLLAQAQISAGQPERGLRTIQIAAQRGWRDPAAQETMLRIALAAGDEAEAARRYTALFLQNRTEDALLEEFGERLFADTNGPATRALVDVLSGSDRWPDTFLRRGARVLPPEAFVAITTEAAARGTPFDCVVMRTTGRALSARSEADAANFTALANRTCAL